MSDPIDVQSEVTPQAQPQGQTQAVTVREAVQALEPAKQQVTAAQAKVEAVANLTMKAYERAGMLTLTPEEIKGLQAEFPDEAFKPGAAGKEHLIYIEHAFLRDRLNQVIGPGQWALIPRSRWAEDFKTSNGKPASRVYVEAMLIVRGAFVSEAVGEMEYYPNNASQNYGDAVEGAKTAALRRCCKEFGIGLQAWKKDFGDGWWARKRGQAQQKPQAPSPAAAPARTATTAAPRGHPQGTQRPEPTGPETFPVVNVLLVKKVDSKPDAPKKWTAYFIKFDDGFGEFEAATFDAKFADLANELANTGESAMLSTRAGRKPGTREITLLTRTEQPPAPEQDEIPMDFDSVPEVTP